LVVFFVAFFADFFAVAFWATAFFPFDRALLAIRSSHAERRESRPTGCVCIGGDCDRRGVELSNCLNASRVCETFEISHQRINAIRGARLNSRRVLGRRGSSNAFDKMEITGAAASRS
jgi:hypothetical protein